METAKAEIYEVLDNDQTIGIEAIVTTTGATWYYSVDFRERYPIPLQSPFKGKFTGQYRDGQPLIVRYIRRLVWRYPAADGLQSPTDQR